METCLERIGKFRVSNKWIDDKQELLTEVFSRLKIIVVRCELHYGSRCFEYEALIPRFELISVAMVSPNYAIWVSMQNIPDLLELEPKIDKVEVLKVENSFDLQRDLDHIYLDLP